jgi:thiol-disulfide isomerase/thioredoxin
MASPWRLWRRGEFMSSSFGPRGAGPCKAAIPHLSLLPKKYEDKLTVIGVNVSERADETTNDKVVDTFVKSMGDKMAYHVASRHIERRHGQGLAGSGGIPTSFIVDGTGKIVTIRNG